VESEFVFEVVWEEWLSNNSKNRFLTFRFVRVISVTKQQKKILLCILLDKVES